jgi:hypothetical protein
MRSAESSALGILIHPLRAARIKKGLILTGRVGGWMNVFGGFLSVISGLFELRMYLARFATELAGRKARQHSWNGLAEEMTRAGWFD